MPSSRASAAACSGPAPPKAKSAKSRGSWPRDSDTMRMAPAILSLAMRRMAAALASASSPSRDPTVLDQARADLGQRDRALDREQLVGIEPAEQQIGIGDGRARRRRGRSRSAPGSAPALSGPTRSMPASSISASEPPPAPMVCTSTIGTWIGMAYSSSSSEETSGTPSSISATSELVPPISYVMTLAKPAALAV